GDSSDAFFIGPELPYPPPAPEGGYKDTSGFLKRQAARFRIFGYDSRNRVVEELTCDNAEIEWTVHVANKKAAWYCFNVALDIPEGVPVPRRNANFTGAGRNQLIIDPGPRPISEGMSRAIVIGLIPADSWNKTYTSANFAPMRKEGCSSLVAGAFPPPPSSTILPLTLRIMMARMTTHQTDP